MIPMRTLDPSFKLDNRFCPIFFRNFLLKYIGLTWGYLIEKSKVEKK